MIAYRKSLLPALAYNKYQSRIESKIKFTVRLSSAPAKRADLPESYLAII